MTSCQAQLDGVVMVVMMQDTIPVRPPLAWAGNFINFGSELRVERPSASQNQPGLKGWEGEIYHLSDSSPGQYFYICGRCYYS